MGARSQSAEVDSCLVCEGSVGKVVGSSSILLATHSRRVAVWTSRPLGVVVHAIQRSSREGSLVTAHQLLRSDLSDELLLACDEVHLWSWLSTTHEGAIACTIEGLLTTVEGESLVLTIGLSRVESVGEGVEAILVEECAAHELWLGAILSMCMCVGNPLCIALGAVLALA